MARNGTNFFYSGVVTGTTKYAGNEFKLRFPPQVIKIIVETQDINVSFGGANDVAVGVNDGLLKVADGPHIFRGIQTNKISFKGLNASVRIWAW